MSSEFSAHRDGQRTPDEIAAGKESVAREQRALELEKIEELRQQVEEGINTDRLARLTKLEGELTESVVEGFSVHELAIWRKLEQTDEPLTETEAEIVDKFADEEEMRFEEWEVLASLLGVVRDD